MERITSDELERRVDEVLFYIWDPIGVNIEPAARAEYRSYVAAILEMLTNGFSEDEIADHLCKIESEYMSLAPNRKSATSTAKLLIEHKEAISHGYA